MRIRPLLLGILTAVALVAPGVPASAGSASTAGAVDSAAHAQQDDAALRAALTAVVAAGASGAIGLVDDGTHVSTVAVGAARLDPRQPIRLDDQVRVGSITKTVISTITLQLVGEGRLHLSDTVQQWLPGAVPNASTITLRMLLNHTNGIFSYSEDPAWRAAVGADPYHYWSPWDLIAVANAHPRVFPPGQGLYYSNTAYLLLGLVLDKVTGQPVQDLVWSRVVRPLHLTSTYFSTSGRFRGPYAHGYYTPSLTGDGYLDTSAWSPSIEWAAGALISTAPDLRRFYQALLSGRLLNPSLLEQMTTTVTGPEYPGYGSGLGIFSIATACGTVWGHQGGTPGYVSIALNNRGGSRSAVLLVPTELDQAIGAAFEAAVTTVVCQMLHRSPSTAS